MNWEDNLLNRQISSMSAALPAFGQAGNQISQGQQLGQSVPQLSSNMFTSAANIGNAAYQQPNMAAGNWLNYIGAGNQGEGNAVASYNAQLEAYKAKQAQDAAMWQGIGSLAGTAAGAFVGMPGLGGQIGGSLAGSMAGNPRG